MRCSTIRVRVCSFTQSFHAAVLPHSWSIFAARASLIEIETLAMVGSYGLVEAAEDMPERPRRGVSLRHQRTASTVSSRDWVMEGS